MSQAKQPETDLTIEAINTFALDQVPDRPDTETRIEQISIENDRKHAELDSYKQDTRERKRYALRIFILTCTWITAIYGMLILDGFGWRGFRLPDSVMLAAIGSTTANIIGVFLIVTRYFFPKK